MSEWFRDRVAVLATMHRKEQVMAPLLEQALGVSVVVPDEFDTDLFGTFTRDVTRPADQLDTARLKARAALERTGASLAIASEGSFGPHPALPFLPCDREIVVLIDQQHDLEIVGEVLAIETNFSHITVSTLEDALIFAQKQGFPEHGLVVMADATALPSDPMIKGITSEARLTEVVLQRLQRYDRVHLETDMRALYNPTRMKAIAQATQALIAKASRVCPRCQTPGFAVFSYQHGLPCAFCRQPTAGILAEIYQCQKCQLTQEMRFPNGIEVADPAQCDFCNP
ncbi:MAG: hypothetical protein KME16_20165 [Scytolyngbya sp. HA4215-MV1]|jgi:hypothetical protein|nr:hypothetical protein [Scytolyngbya sp. HA4215-MV1]